MTDKLTLLHNPRCSKSRQALALLEQGGHVVQVVRYLDEPLGVTELDALCTKLKVEPEALIRWKDAPASGVVRGEITTRQAQLELLARHPRLLERPVLIRGRRAVIARPPERVLELLD